MQHTGNTILITGGGSGIGRALAEASHKLGNKIIIAGRRKALLDEVVAANPGMEAVAFDVQDAASIKALATEVTNRFPSLNVLINNAGIMRTEKLTADPVDLTNAEAMVTTNLLGPIRLTAALLPHLQKQAQAAVMNVSSGLAYVPLAYTPTYCATKAAIHSYTESLRYQLRKTSVRVLELAPPYVQTELMDGAEDPRAMPLAEFISEVMSILQQEPTPDQIYVERVKHLSHAVAEGRYAQTFAGLNGAMADME